MRKVLRRFVNPISRPAMLFLVWTKRHTVMQWGRSLREEFSRGPFEWSRFTTLVRALTAVSTDAKIANSPQLRSLKIHGTTVEADVDPTWSKLAALQTTLGEVKSVDRVAVGAASG